MPDKIGSKLPQVPLKVKVTLEQSPTGDKPPQAVAYAFTRSGHFVAKAAVDEKGNASLSLPGSEAAREMRIVVGPELSEKQPSFSELIRRGAQEQIIRVEREGILSPVSFQIPHQIWPCWVAIMLVQGTLQKSVLSGGLPIDFPVCGAQVQIYEVEPIEIIIPKLPIRAIEELRQAVINPPPPPPPENGIFHLPSASVHAEALRRATPLQLAKPASTLERISAQVSPEFANLQFLAQHANLEEFRQALLLNVAQIRFIFCLLFPRLVQATLITTVTTDQCGNFHALIPLSCFHPTVNLYFTASVNIFGVDFQIYDPTPISCFTYWNYQGQKVTLYTDSALAPCCSPCPPVDAPEGYVLIRAIGNVSLNSIYGTSSTLSGSTTSSNIGLYADGAGPGIDAPFGSLVLPRIEFDPLIRNLNLGKYYQVSWRFGTTGTFQVLPGDIFRHYNHMVGTVLVTEPYKLGPQPPVGTVTNLFEIPPELPPVGGWAFPDPRFDLANAQFPTDQAPVGSPGNFGVYQLKVDLFDAAGNPVNIATAGIRYFVPTFTDSGGVIHTADAATLGLVSGNSFIMSLHIDNRHTSASLPIPTLNSNPPDPACGLLEYTNPSDNVTLQYSASHPDNFATFSYRLSRGVNQLTPPSASGQVSSATDPATVTMSVSSLLGGCAIAGFGEDLYVAAAATDGWRRLSEYDSGPPPVGFVLAPKS
jgi:hypothetical protein